MNSNHQYCLKGCPLLDSPICCYKFMLVQMYQFYCPILYQYCIQYFLQGDNTVSIPLLILQKLDILIGILIKQAQYSVCPLNMDVITSTDFHNNGLPGLAHFITNYKF